MRSAVSPIELKSIDAAVASLQVLDEWATDALCDEETADLVMAGIKEALAGSHEYQDSHEDSITFGRKSLRFSPKVAEYRDVAMGIYKKIFNNDQTTIKAKAISILDEIGDEGRQAEGEFWEKIIAEKQEVLNWIENLLYSEEVPYAVLTEIEDVLIRIWAGNIVYPKLSMRAEKLLGKINRSPEFLVYKLYMGVHFFFPDFEALRAAAPAKDRWSWFVDRCMVEYHMNQGLFLSLIKPLTQKYSTVEDIIIYLNNLDSSLGYPSGSGYVPLIESWGQHNQDAILNIIHTSGWEDRIPERFRSGFHVVAARNIPEYVNDFAQELIGEEIIAPVKLGQLINLAIEKRVKPDVYIRWMEALIPRVDGEAVRLILNRSYYIFRGHPKKQQRKIVALLQLTLYNGLSSNQFDAYRFLIGRIIKENMANMNDLSETNKIIFDVLKNTERLDYSGQSLLELCVGDNLTELLKFIDYRLRQNQERTERYLRAIPLDGFRFMSKIVIKYNDFDTIMSYIVEWSKNHIISSSEIEGLLGNIVDKADEEHGNYLIYYINECLSRGAKQDIENAITALCALSFGPENMKVYLRLLVRAEEIGMLDKANKVFSHNVIIGGSACFWGEVPPDTINKRDTLIAMRKQCDPGRIKSLIESLEEELNATIREYTEK